VLDDTCPANTIRLLAKTETPPPLSLIAETKKKAIS